MIAGSEIISGYCMITDLCCSMSDDLLLSKAMLEFVLLTTSVNALMVIFCCVSHCPAVTDAWRRVSRFVS